MQLVEDRTTWDTTIRREVGEMDQREWHGLTGYSVVQRQLWLMTQRKMTQSRAYDKARKEFYSLRHLEEVERRVAREEATWVGAYFGKSVLEVGMELEDKTYDSWMEWAKTNVAAADRMRDAAYTTLPELEEEAVEDPEAAEAAPAAV